MKVLVISGAFPPMNAGEADHAFHLCHRLAERGLEVHVLTSRLSDAEGMPLPFAVHRIQRRWSWRGLPALVRHVRAIRPDGVLLFYTDWIYERSPAIIALPWLLKVVLPNRTFVTQLETNDASIEVSLVTRAILKVSRLFLGSDRVDRLHINALLKGSDRLIVLSERHRRQLREAFVDLKDEKVIVIPPPPILWMSERQASEDHLAARRELGLEDDDFVVVYFGHINPAKGLDVLIRAMARIEHGDNRAHLLVIGGGVDVTKPSAEHQALMDLARDLGVAERVTWTGRYDTNSDKASRYLHAADAAVLPFTLGVTLNRSSVAAAAAHGLPIITTRPEVLESAFRDLDNVYLCPRKDPEAIARAIAVVRADEELRNRLSAGSLRLAEEYFSWERAVDDTIAALLDGSDGTGRPAAIRSTGPRYN